jgi:transposase InsO family protein
MFGEIGNTISKIKADQLKGRSLIMPWKEETKMTLRTEFVKMVEQGSGNVSELCRRYGVSRKTGYKWLKRYQEDGYGGLVDRSRRPHRCPGRSSPELEQKIKEVRDAHPAWGGRKIRAYLERKGEVGLPSPSTITAILHRNDLINAEEAQKHRAFQRFEMERSNQMWQMDFKGYFAMEEGGYCHPLTVLDDHSRYLVGLRACLNERAQTVQEQLCQIFRYYGLPERMLMDNGAPWGDDIHSPDTLLTAWLIRLGIQVCHGHPYHPQTQGKDERLHRTLKDELLSHYAMPNLSICQSRFDDWRNSYNFERPHEALAMQPPSSRYQPSSRRFPENLPPVLYDIHDIVRKVDASGKISFQNRALRVGKAFRYNPVALRPTDMDGEYDVFFCDQKVAHFNLQEDNC